MHSNGWDGGPKHRPATNNRADRLREGVFIIYELITNGFSRCATCASWTCTRQLHMSAMSTSKNLVDFSTLTFSAPEVLDEDEDSGEGNDYYNDDSAFTKVSNLGFGHPARLTTV